MESFDIKASSPEEELRAIFALELFLNLSAEKQAEVIAFLKSLS